MSYIHTTSVVAMMTDQQAWIVDWTMSHFPSNSMRSFYWFFGSHSDNAVAFSVKSRCPIPATIGSVLIYFWPKSIGQWKTFPILVGACITAVFTSPVPWVKYCQAAKASGYFIGHPVGHGELYNVGV